MTVFVSRPESDVPQLAAALARRQVRLIACRLIETQVLVGRAGADGDATGEIGRAAGASASMGPGTGTGSSDLWTPSAIIATCRRAQYLVFTSAQAVRVFVEYVLPEMGHRTDDGEVSAEPGGSADAGRPDGWPERLSIITAGAKTTEAARDSGLPVAHALEPGGQDRVIEFFEGPSVGPSGDERSGEVRSPTGDPSGGERSGAVRGPSGDPSGGEWSGGVRSPGAPALDSDTSVVLARSAAADDRLPAYIRGSGARCVDIPLYRPVPARSPETETAVAEASRVPPDVFAFTSPSTVEAFLTLAGLDARGVIIGSAGPAGGTSRLGGAVPVTDGAAGEFRRVLSGRLSAADFFKGATRIAIGPTTAAALTEMTGGVELISEERTLTDLARLVLTAVDSAYSKTEDAG